MSSVPGAKKAKKQATNSKKQDDISKAVVITDAMPAAAGAGMLEPTRLVPCVRPRPDSFGEGLLRREPISK
jgi:hypothetical protein